MKAESPRVCKICGGPNHYGCGCEARQLREAEEAGLTENEAKALQEPEPQPASEAKQPAPEVDDDLEDILGTEALRQAHQATLQMQTDVKTMADGFEGLCACMYDTNIYFKLMVGDMITIRKFLTKEDEPEKADRIEAISAAVLLISDVFGTLISFQSNIEQQLKEINARGRNASENKN